MKELELENVRQEVSSMNNQQKRELDQLDDVKTEIIDHQEQLTMFNSKKEKEFLTAAESTSFNAGVGGFSSSGIGVAQAGPNGTTVKFNAPSGSDTMMKAGVQTQISTRHQCITCMKVRFGRF